MQSTQSSIHVETEHPEPQTYQHMLYCCAVMSTHHALGWLLPHQQGMHKQTSANASFALSDIAGIAVKHAVSELWHGCFCQRAYRAHDVCKLFQLAHSQGLQQLNAAQRLDQRLSALFAGSNHCCEGVGVQLKKDACSVAGWLGQKQNMRVLK